MRKTKFVFHISQTQSKEGIVLDCHQLSVFEINHKLETELKHLNELDFYITATMCPDALIKLT